MLLFKEETTLRNYKNDQKIDVLAKKFDNKDLGISNISYSEKWLASKGVLLSFNKRC